MVISAIIVVAYLMTLQCLKSIFIGQFDHVPVAGGPLNLTLEKMGSL
jgi:hypothetical protein